MFQVPVDDLTAPPDSQRPFMKYKFSLFAGAALAFSLSSLSWAEDEHPGKPLGADKAIHEIFKIEVRNNQNEVLGQVKDLGVDLINGRIVEVLIVSDSSLGVANKIVAVPPLALVADTAGLIYRLNVSTETFKAAAGIDFAKWTDYGRSDRIADTYKLFGQDPYFLQEGDVAAKSDERPKVMLGYVERSSKVMDLPVANLQGHEFGKVWSLNLSIPTGRILNVVILAPGNFKTKSIVPAMALAFNDKRDGLILDETKEEYADEPRYVITEAANGQDAYFNRESYKGPRTNVPLVQGSSYRDVDRTVLIHRNIRAARVNGRHVEIGTLNGRVTLRGWVYNEADKTRINDIAIAASRLELVDNQIVVGQPTAKN
jgi:sporulation protein YlmC with PRC-barrel domain